ncbi:MAG: hypothetical protein IJB86_04670 [Clostridia bacterium]|nr:hypothetical protein [Clostridia bacterium]
MKNKFERDFKELAYSEVPDKWKEIEKKVSSSDTPTKRKSFNIKAIASVAASIFIVVLSVSVAVLSSDRKPLPIDTESSMDTAASSFTENEYLHEMTEKNTLPEIALSEPTMPVATRPSNTKRHEEETASAPATTRAEIALEPDWDRKSMPGKFPALKLFGTEYVYPFSRTESRFTDRKVTYLTNHTLSNTNTQTDTPESVHADIYTVDGFSKNLVVGVMFEGEDKPHIYINTSYMPQNLGEFLSAIDFDNTVSYGGITLHSGTVFPVNQGNATDIKKYLLSDESLENTDYQPTGTHVTASINCEELGMSNKAFKIYESGYVTTNLIGYQYTFFVGKDNTESFLKNSYNITFNEINEINSKAEPSTSVSYTPRADTEDDFVFMTTKAYIPE